MAANHSDKAPRRVAVILGVGRSGRNLMDLALPLLARNRNIEMQGVFVEEAELLHAAELPFVKELCRVTFSVREFTSEGFERALVLRMRSAQRALSVLARRTGIRHSFRNVRGPAVRLLLETAAGSDVTIFEPARMLASGQPVSGKVRRRRIAVAVGDPATGRKAMIAAARLAEGDAARLSVLVTPRLAADRQTLAGLFQGLLSAQPVRIRVVAEEAGLPGLVDAVRQEAPDLFVLPATDDLLQPLSLQLLREKLRCPICLVRSWDESEKS